MFNKKTSFGAGVLAVALFLPIAAAAFSQREGERINVAPEETIEESLLTLGSEILISGRVNGDVFFLGGRVVVDGEVNGDLIGLASEIVVNGRVNGDLRVAGEEITINGEIVGQCDLAAKEITLEADARLDQDLYFFSESLRVNGGRIGRDLSGWANQISFSGRAGRNVRWRENPGKNNFLTVFPSAEIAGNLSYNFKNGVSLAENFSIGGQIQHPAKLTPKTKAWTEKFRNALWPLIISFFASFLVGLVLIYFTPTLVAAAGHAEKNFWRYFGKGTLVFFACPAIALILIVILIGWPLGLMLLAAWLTASYSGRVLAAFWVGRWLGQKIHTPWSGKNRALTELAVGLAIVQPLFSLPWLGWLASLGAISFGLGLIWERVKPNKQATGLTTAN